MPTHSSARSRAGLNFNLEALRRRLPDFWWTEVERVRDLIELDPESGRFEAEYLEHAAEALMLAEDELLAHAHAPVLWAVSHQLYALACARQRDERRQRPQRSARTARGRRAEPRGQRLSSIDLLADHVS